MKKLSEIKLYEAVVLENCYILHKHATRFLSPNALSTRATFTQNLFSATKGNG